MWSALEKASARTKGWSTLVRLDCTFIMALEETSSDSDSSRVMDAAQASVPACRSPRGWFSPIDMAWVMSQVMRGTGVMALRTQVLPASSETYRGAFPVREIGLGVNAEATMIWGFAACTA